MTQYLLSVWHSPTNPIPDDPEVMQKAFKQVDAFNAEIQAAGHLGVRRRPARARDRDRRPRRPTARPSSPTVRSPRRRNSSAASGSSRHPISTPRSRGRPRASAACMGPVEVRPFQDELGIPNRPCRIGPRLGDASELERIFREESGRVVATLVRLFGDIDIAEEMVQEAFLDRERAVAGDRAAAESRRLDHHHRPQPRDRPSAARGISQRPPRPSRAAPREHRARRGPTLGERRERRPAPPHLHLLSPGAGAERADRAHAPPARRARDAVHRPRVSRARADDGQAARPRQAEDPRREDPVSRSERRRAARAGSGRCSRSSTSCSTRATPRPTATRSSAPTSAPRQSGSRACSPTLMPDEPEALGLLALLLLTESRRASAHRRRRLARAAPRSGPLRLGPRPHRRRPGDRAALPAPQPARAVPDPGRDQRGAQRRGDRRGHRLAPDRRALRPTARDRAEPDRRAEPRGRGRRGRGPGTGARRSSTRSTSTRTTCSTRPGPSCSFGSTRDDDAARAYDRALALDEQRRRAGAPRERRARLGASGPLTTLGTDDAGTRATPRAPAAGTRPRRPPLRRPARPRRARGGSRRLEVPLPSLLRPDLRQDAGRATSPNGASSAPRISCARRT